MIQTDKKLSMTRCDLVQQLYDCSLLQKVSSKQKFCDCESHSRSSKYRKQTV